MDSKKDFQIGIYAPNLVNVCVDQNNAGEMSGRIYHCYDQKPWEFSNVVELLCHMEALFDAISFPQASTASRTFSKVGNSSGPKPAKVCEVDQVTQYRGKLGTFVTHVQYRQNATWQGVVVWAEAECRQNFVSTLDYLKLLNNALAQ